MKNFNSAKLLSIFVIIVGISLPVIAYKKSQKSPLTFTQGAAFNFGGFFLIVIGLVMLSASFDSK